MKKLFAAFALALLVSSASSPAMAAVVTVSGQGISHDIAIAMQAARADAIGKCTAQGGTPLEEIFSHVTRANQWIASSIWECDVP